jgi:hypothetical protein
VYIIQQTGDFFADPKYSIRQCFLVFALWGASERGVGISLEKKLLVLECLS